MNGTEVIGGGPVNADPGPSWRAIAVGDFDGVGDADILLQNTTSGQTSIWEMNGTSIIGGGPRRSTGPLYPGASRRGQHLAIRRSVRIPLRYFSGKQGSARFNFALHVLKAGERDLLFLVV